MNIIQRNPKELKHYKLNAKKHPDSQITGLAESIKKFGFIQPVVVDKDDQIIIGHGRTMAALRAGLETVPTVKLETLTEQEAKALRLIDNRIAETGYDIDLLKMDIETLEVDLKPFNVSFDELIPLEEKEVIEDDGGAEASDELTEKWGVKTGQIWQLGNHRVMCGDSTNPEHIKRLIDTDQVDMIITDPPYGINLNSTWHNNEKREIIGDGDDFKFELITNIFNQFDCKEIFVFGCDYFIDLIPNYKEGSIFVWDKRSSEDNIGQLDGAIGSDFELCFSKYKHKREIIRALKQTGVFANRTIDKCTNHPTQKPIKLISYLINKFGQKNFNIFDFYLGSGTTLIAAEQLDRRCFGMEISPQYVAVIIDRWATFTGKTPELIDNGEA